MILSKAIDLLKTFSEEDFRKFGLFLSSPYFNKEAVQLRFYKAIKKYYPLFNSRALEKEKIFAKIYPGKKFNDGVMRNVLSTTNKLAEDFLACQKFQNDTFNYNLNILDELNKRKQLKSFEKNFINAENFLESENIRDGEFYYKKFILANEQRKFEIKQKSTMHRKDDNLSELFDTISISFMLNILKTYTYIANTNKYMFQYEQKKDLIDGILNYVNANLGKLKENTYLMYYYNLYMLSKSEDEKYYFDLSVLFKSKHDELSYVDMKNLYTILANYCYTKINKGESKFLNEQFNNYRQSVSLGLYKGERGFMSHIFYINVVITGLESGETAWVKIFIDSHKGELDIINRENTFIFCSAFYNYWIKEFSKALDLAAKVKTDDLSYKHQLKSLYLKIYYDLNEVEPFYSLIDSYRHFITSDENTSGQLKLAINNYMNFSKKLFDLKNRENYTDTDLVMIRNEIVNNKAMINKPWLLRKTEELEKAI